MKVFHAPFKKIQPLKDQLYIQLLQHFLLAVDPSLHFPPALAQSHIATHPVDQIQKIGKDIEAFKIDILTLFILEKFLCNV